MTKIINQSINLPHIFHEPEPGVSNQPTGKDDEPANSWSFVEGMTKPEHNLNKLESELALLENESLYEALSKAGLEGIAIHDQGRVIEVNEKLALLIGCPVSELIGHNIQEFVDPADIPVIKHNLITGSTAPVTGHIRRKDATLIPVEVHPKNLLFRGKPVRAMIIRDITERKQLEENLRQSQQNYHILFENSLDGVMLTAPDGKIMMVNPAICQLLGYTEQEIREGGRGLIVDLTDPNLPSLLEERARTGFARGEFNFIHKDGHKIYCEVTSNIYRGTDGKLFSSMFVRDITYRKEAEKALWQRANEFEALVENSPDIISRMDRAFCHLFVNKAVEAATGIPSAYFKGKTHLELGLPQEIVVFWQTALAQVFETGRELSLDYDFPTPQGSRYYHSRLVPERDETGQVVTVLNIARDVTERKQAEETVKIRAGQQKIVAELGKLALGGREVDLFLQEVTGQVAHNLKAQICQIGETLPGGRKLLLRAATGWDESQIGQFKSEREPNSVSNQTLQTGKPVIIDNFRDSPFFVLPPPLQNKGITSGLSVPISDGKQKEPFGVLCAYTLDRRVFTQDDINFLEAVANLIAIAIEQKKAQSEKLNLERQFLEAQKMESLGVLAGGIAHDFNNLLGSILANTELAKIKLGDDSSNHPAYRFLEQTETATQRAADLVRQLLAYVGKAKFQPGLTNLNELVNEMADLFNLPLTNKAILQRNLQPGLPMVVIDPTQIRQVVMNLIKNGAEAIGTDRGTITLSSGLFNADRQFLDASYLGKERQEGHYIFFEVTDTGTGMDPATLTRIFEPFFSTKFTGRGLGLSAVLGIIRSHHGALKVESQPGKGTTITILLPVGVDARIESGSGQAVSGQVQFIKDSEKAPPLKSVRESLIQKSILVIEDEAALRESTGLILQESDYKVFLAESGRSGLEIYEAQKGVIDVVLLDLVMPQMGGEEVLPRLLELNPAVKVIIMSGYSKGDVAGLVGAGTSFDFLQKPIKINTLLGALNRVLG